MVLASSEATGPCKARALAQQLWDGEEFYLQARSQSLNCWHGCHVCLSMETFAVAKGRQRFWMQRAACVTQLSLQSRFTAAPSCLCVACTQIDSHMRFVKGWDTKMLRMLGQVRCMRLPSAA